MSRKAGLSTLGRQRIKAIRTARANLLPAGHGQPGRMHTGERIQVYWVSLMHSTLWAAITHSPLSWISHFRYLGSERPLRLCHVLREATAQVSSLSLSMHKGPQPDRGNADIFKKALGYFSDTHFRMFLQF